MKDAMEDGLILMYFWLKMDIWFQKNVHHINKKQREIIAVTMAVVNQSLKFKDLILLEEDGETHLKKK
jgi:alkylhydroperoxidase/carboxymuconolactone decarboxylase family protein YurZ